MNENTKLSEYITAEKESRKLNHIAYSNYSKIAKSNLAKIKFNYAWLFTIPLIVHFISFYLAPGDFIDNILMSKNVLDRESIDHLFSFSMLSFIAVGLFYVFKTEEKISKINNSDIGYRTGYDTEPYIGLIFIVTAILFVFNLFGSMNALRLHESTSMLYLITILIATLSPILITCWSRIKTPKINIHEKSIENKKEIKEWLEKNKNKNFLREQVLSDSSAMRTVLKEYEKNSSKYHPDYDYFSSLIDGMKLQNEERMNKYNEMKELKSIYEKVYEDKIEIAEPVGIVND